MLSYNAQTIIISIKFIKVKYFIIKVIIKYSLKLFIFIFYKIYLKFNINIY